MLNCGARSRTLGPWVFLGPAESAPFSTFSSPCSSRSTGATSEFALDALVTEGGKTDELLHPSRENQVMTLPHGSWKKSLG